jgi:hypothetical protein
MAPPPVVSLEPEPEPEPEPESEPDPSPSGISDDIEFATYDYNLFVYAINYNVLRIQSGMASTVFAN